ncbi:MAG: hypothetical protein SGPRY_001557, partial [Prymnesium sp.]
QSKYPWASPQALDWQFRRRGIVSQLEKLDADVVCLQEVELGVWPELKSDFESLGYDSVLQKSKSSSNVIANVVLLRKGHVELVRAESRSRALIAVVRTVRDDSSPEASTLSEAMLYLANVHFDAGGPVKASTREAQLRKLLKRVALQRSLDVAEAAGRPRALSPASDAADTSFVIAGDFNCDRRLSLEDRNSFL